jgi:nucleotide-binding universal stress UspA family protein
VRPGKPRPRDRWYRVRVDVGSGRTPAGHVRAHVFAWRTRRGAVERYWSSLELVGDATTAVPVMQDHANAPGQPEAVLEAVAAGIEAGAPIVPMLQRLLAGPKLHEIVEW